MKRDYPENRDIQTRRLSNREYYHRNRERILNEKMASRAKVRQGQKDGMAELLRLYELPKAELRRMIDSESNKDRRILLLRILNEDGSSKALEFLGL